MATGPLTTVVLLPRYTSFLGAGEFTTAPLHCDRFSGGRLTVWRGPMGGGTTYGLSVEESQDAETWVDAIVSPHSSPVDPGAGDSLTFDIQMSLKWLRVKVELTGTDPAVSTWLTGGFETRIMEDSAAGRRKDV